jgi:hypothetical protein
LPSRSNFGWIVNVAYFAFAGYLFADRRGSSHILGGGSPAVWKAFAVVGGVLAAQGLGMLISLAAAGRHRGTVLSGDAAGLAASIDFGRLPVLLAQLGVFGIFWMTLESWPGVLRGARNPWVYLLSSTLIGLAATAIVAEHHFRAAAGPSPKLRRRWRFPGGVRVTELTASRLVLSQQSMPIRVAAAVLCFGLAAECYLKAGISEVSPTVTRWIGETASTWIGVVFFALLGCVMLGVASSLRVVFDKRADLIEMRGRFAWGRTVVRRVPLSVVSAITVRTETMGASQLINVVAHVGEAELPVIIGSRRPANARGHALAIGRFLDVPVREASRLLTLSPDISVSDILDAIDDVKHGGEEQPIDS